MFKEEIMRAIGEQVKGDIVLESPPDASLGDFAFPCFAQAKEFKKAPNQIAQELAKKIKAPVCVERIEAKGPYVNFFLAKDVVARDVLADVFGKMSAKKTGTIIAVEFSSPNIGKPFHFGHLRSTIIGESIARMLEHEGHSIIRLNYLGDWGTQFGSLICAFEMWGDKKELDKHPIEYLVKLYVRFHEQAEKDPALQEEARKWFAKLEKGDKKASELWGLFKSHSLEEFKRIYKVLGSEFDNWNGEAYYARQVPEALEWVKRKGVGEIDDGALIVRLSHEMPMMLMKSDGTTTYASRDIATLLDRVHVLEAKRVIYVVGQEQKLHFEQLFEVMDKMGHPKENFTHVSFGLYLSPEGGKLSTRKGKIILMEDVLDEAITLARKIIDEKNPSLKNKEEIAQQIGVGAILFGDLMNDREKGVVFDLKRFTSFEGDTGPYLMYTHARAASILRKAGVKPSAKVNASLLAHDAEQQLLKIIMTFDCAVSAATKDCKPHILAQYLLMLGRAFNEFYHQCPCIQVDEDLMNARIALVEASRRTLEQGLFLLGIAAPEEM